MMKEIQLNLTFKGSRNYVQGPDILTQGIDALTNEFPPGLEQLEFSIHKMTSQNLRIFVSPLNPPAALAPNEIAILKFQSNGQAWHAKWIEESSKPTERHPYDEEILLKSSSLDIASQSIELMGESPYNLMETIVSLNKHLHLSLFPEITQQWVFCRWVSQYWPKPETLVGMHLRLKQKLGSKLTCCDVSLDNKVIGQVYFSTRERS